MPVPVVPVDPKREGAASRLLFAPRPLRPLRPNAAEDLPRYRAWLTRRQRDRLRHEPPPPGPPIEVVIAVGQPGTERLGRCLDSIVGQTTASWRVAVVLQEPSLGGDGPLADRLGGLGRLGRLGRERTRVLPRRPGRPVAEGLLAAVRSTSCPAFLVLDQHDELAPDAIALLSAALLDADVAYADEDRVDHGGLAWGPVLKPGWSPELLLSWCYIGHPVAVRVALVNALGSTWPPAGDSWEHDLLLRVTERTERVAHVAEVLCHRQTDPTASDPAGPSPRARRDEQSGDHAAAASPAAVVAALARRGEEATVAPGPLPQTWCVRRRGRNGTRVSAIVPFRDNPRLLRSCVDAVTSTTSGSPLELELVLVDNGSVEPESLTLMEHLAARPDVVLLHDARPFSWAALNNSAAGTARGDVLLFLNDDVVATRPGWLTALVGQAVRAPIGAAGARLLYPDGGIQHVGAALGLVGPVSHLFAGLAPDRSAYLGMDVLTREVSAVTGACLATRRSVFESVGRFDEQLAVDYSDVDFCLKIRQRGLRVVYEPQAELVHLESPSRGTSVNIAETWLFIERWGGTIDMGDPFYNPNLTRVDRSAAIGLERHPLTQWRRTAWLERAISERSVKAVWAALPGVPAIARSRLRR